jgi:Xaa-Pro dipeptidase
MPFHFVDAKYTAHLTKATASLVDRGLDTLLMFAPESHYWICGYDIFGFAMFQCMIVGADGRLYLLTRAPDLRQAQKTSTLRDAQIHIWRDVEGLAPAANLAVLVAKLGYRGKIAMETQTVGLTFANGQSVVSAFDQPLHIGDGIISELRQDRSLTELDMHHRAAALSDDALVAALQGTRAGAFECNILADMRGRCFAVAVTMRAMSLSLAQTNARCSAATPRGGDIWTSEIS